MLAGRDIANTAPYGWNGKYPTLEEYIRFTIGTRMHGSGLPVDDLKALARYVREGLPTVQRSKTSSEGAVARGSAVFHSETVGCQSCHPSDDSFSDGAKHNVASLGRDEVEAQALQFEIAPTRVSPPARKKVDRTLDTPSLLQVGLTAPYLHDGSAKTLGEVFTKLGNHMGTVSALSARERSDLVEYLKTL
jgi:cytochrome c peroxidase